jgi:hypothetical protein
MSLPILPLNVLPTSAALTSSALEAPSATQEKTHETVVAKTKTLVLRKRILNPC